MEALKTDLSKLERKAARDGLFPAARLNGTTDIIWFKSGIMEQFPKIQFYDYSKIPTVVTKTLPDNYHLTFSFSGHNWQDCVTALANGINVAVVFDEVPETFKGYPVINGDSHDLRFLDPTGVIVGLTAKGYAKKDDSPFIVRHKQEPYA